jgi:putative hydrolase of the HAD superfamily
MRPLLPRFLLLDLDDTILDYTATGDACWESLCTSFAPRIGNIQPDELLSAIDRSRAWYWDDPERHRLGRMDLQNARRQVVHHAFEQLQIDNPPIAEELADTFTTTREELVRPFPGAVEALQAFQSQDIRMGLLTNGIANSQRSKIYRFHLEQYFDVILIESEFGVGKPDRRVFLHALERLNAHPTTTGMIGDDLERDIRPAQELGIATFWVNHARIDLPPNSMIVPDWTIHTLAVLLERR